MKGWHKMRHKRILSILIAALAFICLNPQTAMADESRRTAGAYSDKYTRSGGVRFTSEPWGVYFGAVTKGEKADSGGTL